VTRTLISIAGLLILSLNVACAAQDTFPARYAHHGDLNHGCQSGDNSAQYVAKVKLPVELNRQQSVFLSPGLQPFADSALVLDHMAEASLRSFVDGQSKAVPAPLITYKDVAEIEISGWRISNSSDCTDYNVNTIYLVDDVLAVRMK